MYQSSREADVANAVTSLASEQASSVTGRAVGVAGGIDPFSAR
jgi:hypothetical protein